MAMRKNPVRLYSWPELFQRGQVDRGHFLGLPLFLVDSNDNYAGRHGRIATVANMSRLQTTKSAKSLDLKFGITGVVWMMVFSSSL
jgi:hypothetical protein